MRVHCPSCQKEFDIPDEEHYREVVCPNCDNEFQAISSVTERVSREFIEQILRDFKPKPE